MKSNTKWKENLISIVLVVLFVLGFFVLSDNTGYVSIDLDVLEWENDPDMFNFSIAASSISHSGGNWSDFFTDNDSISTKVSVDVNFSSKRLQLINTTDFAKPYNSSGYIITESIIPVSVAAWINITFDSITPAGTSFIVQVLDESNDIYPNEQLSGNENGFTSSPINISTIQLERSADPVNNPTAKVLRLRIKVTFNTTDTSKTSELDNLTMWWTVRQGGFINSDLANTSWPRKEIDKRGTRHSNYYSDPIYPAIHWTKNLGGIGSGDIIRGNDDELFVKTQGETVSSPPLVKNEGKLMAINKTDQTIMWERNISGSSTSGSDLTLSKNNTLYWPDIWHDILIAYNASTGEPKWSYQFNGTHGKDSVVINEDGIIFINFVGINTPSIRAFNPNGSVKWSTTITEVSDGSTVSPLTIDEDNDLIYIGSGTKEASCSALFNDYSNNGTLYAFNYTNGSLMWNYSTGDIPDLAPIVDLDGVVYTANTKSTDTFLTSCSAYDRLMYAIYPNGTLKWQRNISGQDTHWYQFSLRSDNILVAKRILGFGTPKFSIELINTSDGSLIDSVGNFTSYMSNNLFLDGLDGSYFYQNDYIGNKNISLYYYDSNLNEVWKLHYAVPSGQTYSFNQPIIDEDGKVYLFFRNSTSTPGLVTLVALHPWTLSVSTSSNSIQAGNSLNFTVTTSMRQTNLLNNKANKVQVVIDNGDKITLYYNNTNSDNDTIWNGTYNVPSIMSGEHSYTIDACAAGIQTNISLNFTSSCEDSFNTGIITTGGFSVTTISGGGSPNLKSIQTQPIESGVNTFIEFNNPNIPLIGMNVVLNQDASLTLEASKISEHQFDNKLENAYSYFEISSNLDNSYFDYADINFKVKKEFENVKLYQLKDDWNELKITQIHEDSNYNYYQVSISSLGYFGITSSEIRSEEVFTPLKSGYDNTTENEAVMFPSLILVLIIFVMIFWFYKDRKLFLK